MDILETETRMGSNDRLVALRIAATAASVWGVAAFGAHLASTGFSQPLVQFGARLVVIWLCGGLLLRAAGVLPGRSALFVGIAWASAAIATELVLTAHGVQGWYELLGSPSTSPEWMRALTAAAWILSPQLSAKE